VLLIVKRSGATEPFSREKVINGVRKACQGRPVDDDDFALLAQRVEESLRSDGQAEVEAQEVGMAILAPLRELDEVAYLRYASVYRNFSSLEDFEGEIALLRAAPSSNANEFNVITGNALSRNTLQDTAAPAGTTNNAPLSSASK